MSISLESGVETQELKRARAAMKLIEQKLAAQDALKPLVARIETALGPKSRLQRPAILVPPSPVKDEKKKSASAKAKAAGRAAQSGPAILP